MLPELGYYSLILAFFLALIQFIFPLIASLGRCLELRTWRRFAQFAALGQCVTVSFAFIELAYAFAQNDFTVAYVMQNSHTQLPIFYRISALWGAHEGSLLLWSFLLTVWMGLFAIASKKIPEKIAASVLGILGWVNAGFLLFILTVSNPFKRIFERISENGQDLNPLLQDKGLALHPPILYLGYVGFSIVFAFAITALVQGQLSQQWARWMRPWALGAWCFLTWGIVAGSWWAYRVLGWGGWWFWDPVENSSLLPWLAGTALIHSLLILEKRETLKSWVVLLAITTFALSILGTFLVRSGILISVHSFAIDTSRGLFMLALLIMFVGSSLLLYAFRAHSLKASPSLTYFSREMLIKGNNILLSLLLFVVLLGTLYPLFIEIMGWGKISVGAPYFNFVFQPFMWLLFILMSALPFTNWYKSHKPIPWITIILLMSFIICGSALSLYFSTHTIQWPVLMLLSLIIFLLINTLKPIFNWNAKKLTVRKIAVRQLGMMMAHCGVGISAIGVLFSSYYSVHNEILLKQEEKIEVSGYTLIFRGIKEFVGPNFQSTKAIMGVTDGKQFSTMLEPELRNYWAAKMYVSKPAIDASIMRDVYIALSEPVKDNWAFRIYVKPFIRWIWAGGVMMLLGGIISIWQRIFYAKIWV